MKYTTSPTSTAKATPPPATLLTRMIIFVSWRSACGLGAADADATTALADSALVVVAIGVAEIVVVDIDIGVDEAMEEVAELAVWYADT